MREIIGRFLHAFGLDRLFTTLWLWALKAEAEGGAFAKSCGEPRPRTRRNAKAPREGRVDMRVRREATLAG